MKKDHGRVVFVNGATNTELVLEADGSGTWQGHMVRHGGARGSYRLSYLPDEVTRILRNEFLDGLIAIAPQMTMEELQ